MKLFYTNSSAKEEIANLETRISGFENDAIESAKEITRLTEELKTANESVSALTTERDEAVAAFESADKERVKATADLATANEKLATFDTEVENAAQAKFASLGGPPVPASGNDDKGESAMTRAEFNSLDHPARNAFITGGGKLKD